MNLTKKDAEILDNIVNMTFNNKHVSTKDLDPLQKSTSFNDFKEKENQYKHYFELLGKENVVEIGKGFNDESQAHRIEIKTKEFIDNGGFSKLVQDELEKAEKQIEIEKLEIELAKSNLEANELNKSIAAKNEEDKKRNRTERIINISLGVLNLVLLIVQILISLYKD